MRIWFTTHGRLFVEIAQAVAAVSGIKTLIELARDFSATKPTSEIEAVRAEMLRQLTDVHSKVLELQDQLGTANRRVQEIRKENERLRDWTSEREKYELKEMGPEAFAYVLKDTRGDGPTPRLCAHCFVNAERSILQSADFNPLNRVLECPRCNNQVRYRDLEQVDKIRAQSHRVIRG